MHWLARSGVLAGLALTGVLSACGGTSSSGVGQGPVAQGEFPRAFARAVCSNIGPCCTLVEMTFDAATCEPMVIAAYESDSSEVDLSTYDAHAAGGTFVSLPRGAALGYDDEE